MKKLSSLITASVILSSFSVVNAMVYGGSNLPLSDYPDFKSYNTPSYYGTPSAYEMDRYHDDLVKYIDNANNDIERIIEAKNKAIRDYNDAVIRYNQR